MAEMKQGVPACPNAGAYPSRWAVLDELRCRDPARYEHCVNFSYTPGSGTGATVEQIADSIQAVDREMENPLLNLAARLGGQCFMLEDSCRPQIDFAGGFPGKPVELTPPERMRQRTYRECADLMREAETLLRSLAAQGIDAATAGETGSEADGLDPKDESPVGKADAPTLSNPSSQSTHSTEELK